MNGWFGIAPEMIEVNNLSTIFALYNNPGRLRAPVDEVFDLICILSWQLKCPNVPRCRDLLSVLVGSIIFFGFSKMDNRVQASKSKANQETVSIICWISDWLCFSNLFRHCYFRETIKKSVRAAVVICHRFVISNNCNGENKKVRVSQSNHRENECSKSTLRKSTLNSQHNKF